MKLLWTSFFFILGFQLPLTSGDLCRALSLNSTTFYTSVSFLRNIHKTPSSSSSLLFLQPLHFPLLWPAVSGNTSRSQSYHYAGCDLCVSDREGTGVFKLRPSSEFLRTRAGVLVMPISEACEVLYLCFSRAIWTVDGLMDVNTFTPQKRAIQSLLTRHLAKRKAEDVL